MVRSHLPRILLFLAVVTVLLVPTLVSPVRQAHAASSPDLTVDSIWLEESSNPGQPVAQVNPGDQFLIVASIKNLGTAIGSGYYLDVYYDSEYGRGGPDIIAAGETQVWYVGPLTAQAGTHSTTWTLDPDNQIVELDESNNQKEYTFTIGAEITTTTSTSNSTAVLTTETTQTSTNTTTSTTATSTSSTTTTSSTSTTPYPATVSITLTANPSGSIVVDGTTYTSQQTFTWIPGSSHTITANSPVPVDSGTQYVWASWADGGDQSRTITTPSSDTAYLANYQTQYQVTYSQTGCSLPVSLPATEWVNAGVSAVGVFPSTVISDDGKTQCPLQNASSPGPIDAPTALAATYKTQYYLTVTSSYGNPTGQGWYNAGSAATYAVTSPASGGAGTQYAFTGWVSSDTGGYTGADASHSFTVDSPITETASWKTQWQFAFAVNPSPGGAVTVNGQPSATAWYDDGAVINVQASHNTGYAFSSWSGDDVASMTFANSTSLSTTVTVHGTGTITANFNLQDTTPSVITSTVTPSASSNGWNNGPVTVSWSVSDPESGIASSNGCATTTLNNETSLEGTALTCTVTNGAGLSNSGSVTVKIDLTAPTLTLPSPTAEATGPSGASVSYDASASDSLSGVNTFSCTPASGSMFPLGNSTVSCSAKDKAGNALSGTFSVTVQDKTPPVVTVPGDMTLDATGPAGAIANFTVSAVDNVDGPLAPNCSPASGSTFALGSTTVTCSVTDKAGNTGSGSFKVTVVDRTPPTLQLPSDMTMQGTGPGGAAVTFSPSASDLIDGSVLVTCNPASGSTFPFGTTTVSCSASDKAGNTATGSFTVTVENKTPPVLTLPGDITVNATGPAGAIVTFAASASSVVDGSVPVTCAPLSGSIFPLGTTTVSCSATDKAGNNASGTFTVTVQDKTAPVVTVPADITVNATGPNGAVVTYTASASDLVDGPLAPTCTPSSGSTFALGSTTVTCSVTDKTGNTGSASFQVTVVDTAPPVLQLPSDMTVQASSTGAVVTFSTSASDLVDGSIPITCTPASGSTFPLGTNTVTCSASDKTGNMASASFKVTVTPSSSTVAVTVKLLDSNRNGLSGGVVQYYSLGWRSFGTTGSDGTVSMALPPGTYTFQMSYAGASQQKSQNVGTNPTVVFQTTLVTMKLLSSTGQELSGGAQYYASGWKTFGGGTTTVTLELLPLAYAFQVSYAGASQQKNQNVASNPNVTFQTTLVTLKLLASNGSAELAGTAQYYAGGWKMFGVGTTTVAMELLPLTYTFRVSWAGASQQKSQNIATNASVIFQTVQVHSDNGKCTSYYAGGWRTFTQDMELLPGTYTFRFIDGTVNTSYTIVTGAVKHIH